MLGYEKKGIKVSSEESKDIQVVVNKTKKGEKDYFLIPNYLTYILKPKPFEEALKQISKSKQKKVRKFIKSDLDKYEIIKEKPVTKESYLNWLENTYKYNLSKKDKGILNASSQWYLKSPDTKMGVFLKLNDKIIAGIIGREYPKNEQLDKRFSISYSAINKDIAQSGLGEYINLLVIDLAYKYKYPLITRGKDINCYGWHLSPGLSVFKTSLGFQIIPLKKEGESVVKFNNLDAFQDIIIFFSYNTEKGLVSNIILKNENDKNKLAMYDSIHKNKSKYYLYKNRELIPFIKE